MIAESLRDLAAWLVGNFAEVFTLALSLVCLGHLSAHCAGWRYMALALLVYHLGVVAPITRLRGRR